MLNATKASKEAKTFETHAVLPQDPFELAAAEAMASGTNPGAWPFACALILLGLLAAGMRANELKRTLRRERVRSLRMQRMIQPQDALNGTVSADLAVNAEGGVEEILTRPNRLDFEDIIASLEMDHGTDVEWELQGNAEGQSAPEGLLSLLSVTVKRLAGAQTQRRVHPRGHPQRLARHPRGIGRPRFTLHPGTSAHVCRRGAQLDLEPRAGAD